MGIYKTVTITAGRGGFGGPLVIVPNDLKNKIVNITGGVISPISEKIAEMTGCTLVDGFKTKVPDNEIACIIIDCGGTLRCGIYPQKKNSNH
jgi:PTS system glucitol/sorbitol-specific IIC component